MNIGPLSIGNGAPLVLIAGPCKIESEEHSMLLAARIYEICNEIGMPYIFKASFDKANRSSLSGQRGVGLQKGLPILAKIRERFGCPVLSDVHNVHQCEVVGEICDVLQIPAFLSRQTDLLLAAGKTGRAVNVKKGQFLSPRDMSNVAEKIASTGNNRILLCERGTGFGDLLPINWTIFLGIFHFRFDLKERKIL